MRVVLDPNVLIAALLSPSGAPAQLLREWQHGRFDLVVSPALLAELERALGYPKLRPRIKPEEVVRVVEWLTNSAILVDDPDEPAPISSSDPGDDYLIALAAGEQAALVSGDRHLLRLAGDLPILSPARFLRLIRQEYKGDQ